jgi:3-methyladenine DNA glycosylase/8-oxoguanine DNA glycosylase
VVELERDVEPKWPLRLPRWGGPDGLARVRDGALRRLVHLDDEPVLVTVRARSVRELHFAARAESKAAAEHGIERMRFALGVDDDLRPFYERFRWDPIIGPAVRRDPLRRTWRKPQPYAALVAAITEQLIEFERAIGIQKRLVARLGRRCPETGLRDLPSARKLGGTAPALLQSLDLSAGRAAALRRACRDVAAGRVDLEGPEHERAWQRLRAIPGIGSWTVEMLALTGQGRLDVVPAGDLGFLKAVGRLKTGNPHVRAEEAEVREFFTRFDPWAGQAAAYLHSTPLATLAA